ncbi:acetyl-coenzyme A synthetase 2-like, mitochondrial [Pseudoliparis swirei]|uniref:acetyl-coenzyme A synthetase 2-like, mitochondrial n=1 Tax=Pseudoliparis swirei TaxID=2059687 RepID=UPI0024BEE93F|nr:acetyl-coenzyme A synthetase 2-like, mitochondrial [Pseudoliparis swirei]
MCPTPSSQCKAVVTCNQGVRGGQLIDLKATVDAAVKSCPTVQHVFVAHRTENPVEMGPLDVHLEECPLRPPSVLRSLWTVRTSCSCSTLQEVQGDGLRVHEAFSYLLLKYDESFVKQYDRSSLRTLGSVGEPINREAWHWFHQVVGDGRCPLVDTWWQTETGGVCIAPRPAEDGAAIIPAMAMRPFFGIQPELLGEKSPPDWPAS